MEILDTVHKRKSATITSIVMILLLLLIFFFGMTYMDPPIESGIAVNFGTSEVGSGNIQPREPVKTEVNPVVEEAPEETVEEEVEEQVEEAPSEEDSPTEELLTQDDEESILLKAKEEERKKIEEAERLAKEEADRLVQEEADRLAKEEADRIKKEQEEEEIRKKLDAQMSGLINSDGTTGGEGNDNEDGDKGKLTGDIDAKAYEGPGGDGGGENYQLGGRKNLNDPQPEYPGLDEGKVFVRVEVDRNGKVVKASIAKGTTVIDSEVLLKAKEAALNTKWEAKSSAPVKQIGQIIFSFGLTAKN